MTDIATDGTGIIGALLRDHEALTSIVPVGNIKRGRLPDNISLPALVVTEISQVERHALVRGTTVRTVDRVAVAGRFASNEQRTKVMEIVKQCCAGRTGTIAGAANVSILTAGRGPDLNGPGDSFEKTADFRVSYDVPTSLT